MTAPAAEAPTAEAEESPKVGPRFLGGVMDWVFMTEWCGLSVADATRAMGRTERVVTRYRAYLRDHPEIRKQALAPYTGEEQSDGVDDGD